MAKQYFSSWFWRAKHWAGGMFAGTGAEVVAPGTILKNSDNTTADTSYNSDQLNIVEYQFGNRHFGRWLLVHEAMEGRTSVLVPGTASWGSGQVLAATRTTAAADAYDSTVLNLGEYQFGNRHFGRFQLFSNLESGQTSVLKAARLGQS